jgi:hypothetical protein
MELAAIGPRREFEWFFEKRLNEKETIGSSSHIYHVSTSLLASLPTFLHLLSQENKKNNNIAVPSPPPSLAIHVN